jgi:hypothetical protein
VCVQDWDYAGAAIGWGVENSAVRKWGQEVHEHGHR